MTGMISPNNKAWSVAETQGIDDIWIPVSALNILPNMKPSIGIAAK